MKDKARTFNQIQNEKSYDELNTLAKKVTELYANSDDLYSQSCLAKDNNLTKKGFRQLMDYAISSAIVSLETANKVYEKSIRNQRRKVADAGANSYSHHKKLIKIRNDIIAYGYLNAQVKEFAISVASDFSKPLSYFSEKYNIESIDVTKILLKRAIEENSVSDEIAEKIIARSI